MARWKFWRLDPNAAADGRRLSDDDAQRNTSLANAPRYFAVATNVPVKRYSFAQGNMARLRTRSLGSRNDAIVAKIREKFGAANFKVLGQDQNGVLLQNTRGWRAYATNILLVPNELSDQDETASDAAVGGITTGHAVQQEPSQPEKILVDPAQNNA